MPSKLFDILVKRLRQVASLLSEKPTVKVDDYALEHLLLYHGLVGTSPENQRSFRDVRQDLFDAVAAQSGSQMAICLKLPPLWWADKLTAIFSEVTDKESAVKALLPETDDQPWPSITDPLGHDHWHVRANAAMLLAQFDVKRADQRMARALDDTANNAKAAFCHIAYALGKLGTPVAQEALKRFLFDKEPWFRVDAAGALCLSLDQSNQADLMQAIMDYHELNDYTAVAVARRHPPKALLQDPAKDVKDGGCAVVIGVLEASKQTFGADIVFDTKTTEIIDSLKKVVADERSPLRMRALRSLATWMIENLSEKSELIHAAKPVRPTSDLPSKNELSEILLSINAGNVSEILADYLKSAKQIEHAIKLTAELGVKELTPQLISLLNDTDSPLLDITILSLGLLGDIRAADPLVTVARKVVDIKSRSLKTKSKQPVFEEEARAAKTYWTTLKALGTLPSSQSVSLLLEASQDFAPDKREQALSSLVSCCLIDASLASLPSLSSPESPSTVAQTIAEALSDPASGVRCAALKGAGELGLTDLVDRVTAMINAKEISLSRQAAETLTFLHTHGHAQAVRTALKQTLDRESDGFKRKKLSDLLQAIGEG